MLEQLGNALDELAVAIAKLKYVQAALQKAARDELKRQRALPPNKPKDGEN
jgi:hypothetical protein